MTAFSPESTQFVSFLPQYINTGNATSAITVSGTVADGTTTGFSTTISLAPTTTKYDIYATNEAVGSKQQMSGTNVVSVANGVIAGIFQFASQETVAYTATQAGQLLTVSFSVTNQTGAPVTLVTQTFDVEVVQYALPI